MDNGKIVEQGTHDELMAKQGEYSRLVLAQALRSSVAPTSDATPQDSIKLSREPTREKRSSSISSEAISEVLSLKTRPVNTDHTLTYLMGRLFSLNQDQWRRYLVGSIASCLTGMIYPAMGIVFGKLSPVSRRRAY